jgi:hypothetical protein
VDGEGENLSAAAFGVAHDLVRSLARGEIEPEAESDLHHLTADVAAHQAERFIEQSVEKGRRCVLLIHGRGLHSGPSGPALRSALVEYLCRQPLAKHVLAFHLGPAPSRRPRRTARASATSVAQAIHQTEASCFTTEITAATEPDRKEEKGGLGAGPNPFPSDLCALCGEISR